MSKQWSKSIGTLSTTGHYPLTAVSTDESSTDTGENSEKTAENMTIKCP